MSIQDQNLKRCYNIPCLCVLIYAKYSFNNLLSSFLALDTEGSFFCSMVPKKKYEISLRSLRMTCPRTSPILNSWYILTFALAFSGLYQRCNFSFGDLAASSVEHVPVFHVSVQTAVTIFRANEGGISPFISRSESNDEVYSSGPIKWTASHSIYYCTYL